MTIHEATESAPLPTQIETLEKLDRYECHALSRRTRALKVFNAAMAAWTPYSYETMLELPIASRPLGG